MTFALNCSTGKRLLKPSGKRGVGSGCCDEQAAIMDIWPVMRFLCPTYSSWTCSNPCGGSGTGDNYKTGVPSRLGDGWYRVAESSDSQIPQTDANRAILSIMPTQTFDLGKDDEFRTVTFNQPRTVLQSPQLPVYVENSVVTLSQGLRCNGVSDASIQNTFFSGYDQSGTGIVEVGQVQLRTVFKPSQGIDLSSTRAAVLAATLSTDARHFLLTDGLIFTLSSSNAFGGRPFYDSSVPWVTIEGSNGQKMGEGDWSETLQLPSFEAQTAPSGRIRQIDSYPTTGEGTAAGWGAGPSTQIPWFGMSPGNGSHSESHGAAPADWDIRNGRGTLFDIAWTV